jgi:uncharacterized protein (DUF924 family)
MTDLDPRAEAVLTFWLTADRSDTARVLTEMAPKWFRGGEAFDQACRDAHGDDVAKASAGELDDWASHPHGRLALVLLLDQWRRNLYHDTAEMVALDDKAMALVVEGEANGHQEALQPIEQGFFLMPHMHSEDLAMQDEGVRRFKQLAEQMRDAPEEVAKRFAAFVDYAIQHRDIIARFGRFPHRNAFLGRESTEEELAFLKEPGSSF